MWTDDLAEERQRPYFQDVLRFVRTEREKKEVYPPADLIFQALQLTPFEQVKVVILGQDPYHGPGQAHGLSFSVPEGVKPPPSLRNIKKEIAHDLGLSLSPEGCLTAWAQQGVLLLNSVLTVEKSAPQSHAKIGWQRFTDKVIACLNSHPEAIVFMLWGAYAKRKAELLHNPNHLVLTAPHPSPLSAHRGFLGCRHFSKCNQWLMQHNRGAVDWSV